VRRHSVATSFFAVDGLDMSTVGHSASSKCGHYKYLFASEQNDADITTWVNILRKYFERLSLAWKFASRSALGHMRFLRTNISQGSVATNLRCAGMFSYHNARYLQLSLPLKEF